MQQVWSIPALTLALALALAITLTLSQPQPQPHPESGDQVWSIPARFADEKDALRVAHKRLRELCETLPKEAVVDASKPEVN